MVGNGSAFLIDYHALAMNPWDAVAIEKLELLTSARNYLTLGPLWNGGKIIVIKIKKTDPTKRRMKSTIRSLWAIDALQYGTALVPC